MLLQEISIVGNEAPVPRRTAEMPRFLCPSKMKDARDYRLKWPELSELGSKIVNWRKDFPPTAEYRIEGALVVINAALGESPKIVKCLRSHLPPCIHAERKDAGIKVVAWVLDFELVEISTVAT